LYRRVGAMRASKDKKTWLDAAADVADDSARASPLKGLLKCSQAIRSRDGGRAGEEAPAAITQGRTITEARRRVREALGLALNDNAAARRVELKDEVKLPADTQRALRQARAAHARHGSPPRARRLRTRPRGPCGRS
jgi:predicted RNase H-like HicB family nuclease